MPVIMRNTLNDMRYQGMMALEGDWGRYIQFMMCFPVFLLQKVETMTQSINALRAYTKPYFSTSTCAKENLSVM